MYIYIYTYIHTWVENAEQMLHGSMGIKCVCLWIYFCSRPWIEIQFREKKINLFASEPQSDIIAKITAIKSYETFTLL